MNLYIDFFTTLPQKPIQKYHGGGNYTRTVVSNLIEKVSGKINIIILCPEWYTINSSTEPVFYKCSCIEWKHVKKIDETIQYIDNSVLWFPILYLMNDFKVINKIKEKHPSLKVCATIHDLRMLDFVWDFKEKYYYSGIQKNTYLLQKIMMELFFTRTIKKRIMKKCISKLDQIYTVSNFAMQNIIEVQKEAKVSLYYPPTLHSTLYTSLNYLQEREVEDEYILFVSGGRILKNFSSALQAFCLFKKKNPNRDIKLMVVGISEKIFFNLCNLPGIDKDIVEKYVIYDEYVDNEELSKLYKNCRFALYTSKKEGFGLPVIEAAFYGKTSIVSNRTSIPEVLGSAVRYVYPLNINDICLQFEYFMNDDNLKRYELRVNQAMKYIYKRMDIETQFMIEDLIERKECK
ncbi:MAG: glycosyltransferase [Lachnospiraceae bacterium]|nr:glycosyltransferase [Lachnospiraceae bacterium]